MKEKEKLAAAAGGNGLGPKLSEKKFLLDNMKYLLKECGHGGFHKKCVTKWCKTNKCCPICRVEVEL